MILALRLRHTRVQIARLFPPDVFRDYAWDMMLELFIARGQGKTLFVKDLFLICGESSTTSLRRIDRLQAVGLLRRRLDRADHRRIRIDLTDKGYTSMVLMLEHLFDTASDSDAVVTPKSFVPQAVPLSRPSAADD